MGCSVQAWEMRSCFKQSSSGISGSCSDWIKSLAKRSVHPVIWALYVPVYCDEKRAELKGKVIDLPVDVCPNPHLLSRALLSDQMNEVMNSGGNGLHSHCGWAQPYSSNSHKLASALKEASWGCLGIWLGCLRDASLGSCFRACVMGRGPRGRPRIRYRDYGSVSIPCRIMSQHFD